MSDQDLYSGLIRLHVLYHAAKERIFGLGMMKELQRHGYRVGPGTFYPLLHRMEERGYLKSQEHVVGGKLRRSYTATAAGRRALGEAKKRVLELFEEIFEDEEAPAAKVAHEASPRGRGRTRGGRVNGR